MENKLIEKLKDEHIKHSRAQSLEDVRNFINTLEKIEGDLIAGNVDYVNIEAEIETGKVNRRIDADACDCEECQEDVEDYEDEEEEKDFGGFEEFLKFMAELGRMKKGDN